MFGTLPTAPAQHNTAHHCLASFVRCYAQRTLVLLAACNAVSPFQQPTAVCVAGRHTVCTLCLFGVCSTRGP